MILTSDLSALAVFAVHIPDGNVLTPLWLIGGYLLAGILVVMGSWRIQDEEIPQVALLTAAFFVASLMHVPVPGLPSSAHLLLNGLLGVVLGRRAALAIAMGLLLQAVLLQHGGLTTLGVNCWRVPSRSRTMEKLATNWRTSIRPAQKRCCS